MTPDYYGTYKGCDFYVSGSYIDWCRRKYNDDAVQEARKEIDYELEKLERK